MQQYCMYLRKSRKDILAEEHGEGETLKRHEKTLYSLANSMGIIVPEHNIYREILSGETIASRPVMQQLLTDVECGKWDGVLVVEVERLARGDTMDQGLVSQVFRYSNTKIITPLKTYEPANESDEEYFEFGLFMSRREYKKINQRLSNGRIASVKEGKFVGNKTPFGYERIKIKGDKGFTLVEDKTESDTVRTIFQLYAYENLSLYEVARRLNSMGLKPKYSDKWSVNTVKDTLNNPVYIGKIRWNARKQVKHSKNGEIIISRPRNTDDVIITNGLHPPLIDEETWEIVQERRKLNEIKKPHKYTLQNPLAGIVICGKCGKNMQRRPYHHLGTEPTLLCPNTECNNVSSKFSLVEQKILTALSQWVESYKTDFQSQHKQDISHVRALESALKKLVSDLKKSEKKLSNICGYFEDGTYTKELYHERSAIVLNETKKIKNNIAKQEEHLNRAKAELEYKQEYIPTVKNVLEIYLSDADIEDKNKILNSILEKVIYVKNEKALKKNSDPTNFEIKIYPRLNKKSD